MKTLKFKGFKADWILKGKKISSLRLFDDKDIKRGDDLDLINSDTKKKFAKAKVIEVIEKKLKDITQKDLKGHEDLGSEEEMVETMKKYYGNNVTGETPAKIVRFRIKGKKRLIFVVGGALLILFVGFFGYRFFLSAPQRGAEIEQFTIILGTKKEEVVRNLFNQGFIRNESVFASIIEDRKIEPGGFLISKGMTPWELADTLSQEPSLKWVVIPEGYRKEQIAELLAKELNWSNQQKSDWIIRYTSAQEDYLEGVYFPDTYLIPKNEDPALTVNRLRAKFNDNFEPYSQKFLEANIKWTTALKLASIVQREAASKKDMPLIAGILWNRLLNDQRLEVDATVQYARDNEIHFKNDPCQVDGEKDETCRNTDFLQSAVEYISEGDWWNPIKVSDKQIDSPYNTYLYEGLPPHPICNPGLAAIDAVLNSTETDCLYYIHDKNRQIHCSKTYAEHLRNISLYLK